MTADVIDRPRAVLPEIPAWVPTAVADCAILTLALTDPSRTILTRLLTDPRMRSVWAELTRKERRTGRFLHPSRLEERFAEASERQERAIGALILLVLWPYQHGVRPTARLHRDVDKDR